MDSEARSGLLYVFVSTLGFSTLPIFTKLIYAWSDLQPLDVAFWRFVFAIPLIWLFGKLWTRYIVPFPAGASLPRVPLLLTGLVFTVAALSAVYGLPHIDASIYVVLFFTYPAMTGILAALLGNPLPLRGWVAVVLTLVGVALTAPEVFAFGELSGGLLGIWIALLNAFAVAVYFLLMARITRGYPATVWSTVWSMTGTAFLVLPLGWLAGVTGPGSLRVWLILAALGMFSTVIPIFGITMGVRKLGASRAAIVGTLEPAVVIIMAALLLGERLQWIQLVGAALIITSIIILEFRNRPVPAKAASIPENA